MTVKAESWRAKERTSQCFFVATPSSDAATMLLRSQSRAQVLCLLGRVAHHQPCANCAEAVPCSRAHAVACSDADGSLFGQFPLAADPDEGP
ncbi:hypothetical protein HDU67_004983, partial [Dinochytrium kinnereticum]